MAAPKPEDIRIQRTYSLLLQALSSLLAEKPFDEISVTDLCKRSGIHRSTFYAHFEDKYQLLTFSIQEIMDILVPPSPATDQNFYLKAAYAVFQHFLKNRRIYASLLLDPRNAAAKSLFIAKYTQAYERLLKRHFPFIPLSDLAFYSRHFAGGLMSVVEWWLETNAQDPPDQMAAQFVRLVPNHMTVFGTRTPKAEDFFPDSSSKPVL